jgi:NADPH:quinone reductase-like Zn-dependent oxidoreductase
LTLKPTGMTFEQAAALPQAALLALQGLRKGGEIQPGQKVLINGAGGGAGTFAIQMAKTFGAEVTGVDSAAKLDLMRSLGADHVIDYRQVDYTQHGQRYDLILDLVARRSIFDYKRALTPTGKFVMVGGSMAALFQAFTLGTWLSKTGSQQLGVLAYRTNGDMAYLLELFEAGKVVPVIDREYPLSETAEALRRIGAGDVQGKLVIVMERNPLSSR